MNQGLASRLPKIVREEEVANSPAPGPGGHYVMWWGRELCSVGNYAYALRRCSLGGEVGSVLGGCRAPRRRVRRGRRRVRLRFASSLRTHKPARPAPGVPPESRRSPRSCSANTCSKSTARGSGKPPPSGTTAGTGHIETRWTKWSERGWKSLSLRRSSARTLPGRRRRRGPPPTAIFPAPGVRPTTTVRLAKLGGEP